MKQSQKSGNNNHIGAIGEKIANRYLQKKGFLLLDQNYLRKWGEIDLIFQKGAKIHFVEVKTVSHETKAALKTAVSYGTWRPEEQVTAQKIAKMNRAIESWLQETKHNFVEWQIDVVAIRTVPHEKFATVTYLPNVIM